MCGIAGLYGWSGAPDVLDRMSAAIAHRGPDGVGRWDRATPSWQAGLAQRRLAIIDLSTDADQPFVKDGLVLVYNGELYNYRELRRELEAIGVRFRTSSDTEVVLESWRRWGPDSLRRFRGMFAFGLLDEQTGRLVLARDHFGIKPLFYAQRGAGLAFCSELKGLLPALGGSVDLDPEAIIASLMYYWIPEGHCAVRGVEKLAPGHWAEVAPGRSFTVHQYWSPVRDLVGEPGSLTATDLLDILEDSVQKHLIADVPVSTFLSGGLDSSLVTVLAKRSNPQIDAYTISFREEDQRLEAMPDDLHYAKVVAQQYGIDLHEIRIEPDVVSMLPKMVHHLDEPIGDAAAINTYLICTAAREAGVKVLLSGMGADELFGGYRKHYACLLAARYRRLPSAVRQSLITPTVGRLPVAVGSRGLRWSRWAKRFVAFADLPEEAAFRRSYTIYGQDEFADLLDPSLMPAVQHLFDEHAAVYEGTGFDDPVNRMCMTDVQMFLAGLNLAYTDRSSMAASTEVRVPYVDVEVAKAAFTFSAKDKIHGRERKAILKKAAEGVLPKEIIYRPKGLFSAPLRSWVRRDLSEMVDDLLPDGQLVRMGMIRRPAVERMIREDRAGTADRSKEIWQLLTLEEWIRQADIRTAGISAMPATDATPVRTT